MVQFAENLPGFGDAVLGNEPARGLGDPGAADEEDERWDAGEGEGAAPAEGEVAGDLERVSSVI